MDVSRIAMPALVPTPVSESTASTGAARSSPFARIVEQVLEKTSAVQSQADQAVRDLAMGQTENVHNVLLAVAKADLTFRMVLEIRNRVSEALQEVMRMQV
jgi:flagellar hook-basal body complex protein FliE